VAIPRFFNYKKKRAALPLPPAGHLDTLSARCTSPGDDLIASGLAWRGDFHDVALHFPISARAIGEVIEMRPPRMSASSSPTSW